MFDLYLKLYSRLIILSLVLCVIVLAVFGGTPQYKKTYQCEEAKKPSIDQAYDQCMSRRIGAEDMSASCHNYVLKHYCAPIVVSYYKTASRCHSGWPASANNIMDCPTTITLIGETISAQ